MQDTIESMKADELDKYICSDTYKFAMRRLPSESIKQEKSLCKKEEGKEGIEEKRTGEKGGEKRKSKRRKKGRSREGEERGGGGS